MTGAAGGTVHVVMPDAVDDPLRPSGGNTYDRQVCDGLRAQGWRVDEHPLAGTWPRPDQAARRRLAEVLARIPDGTATLVDGLIGSTVPDVLLPQSRRLRLVVLLHMPQPDAARACEQAVLSGVAGVVTTSSSTQQLVVDRYGLSPRRVHVAPPGVEPAPLAAGTPSGARLLCVAAVTPGKGHDLLLSALGRLAGSPGVGAAARDAWHCTMVGSLTRDPGWAAAVQCRTVDDGLAEQVTFTGARVGQALASSYAAADVLVLASRAETYGMVVTEALARGLPVVATSVGGVPEALGQAADGTLPGLLVPAGDAVALAGSLRSWLDDDDLRRRLRRAAADRRGTLLGWSETTAAISRVLAEVAA